MEPDFKRLDLKRPIVMCRTTTPPEPIDPRLIRGYRCVACAAPLQVTRGGVKQIREQGGQPICNQCGGVFMQALLEAPPPKVEIRLSPETTAQIEEETGEPILETFPFAETKILEGDDD